MHTEDTIAAISTPPGRSGIGIVRLSGGAALKIADRIFISPKKKKIKQMSSHSILYGHIIDPEDKETVDEALVSIMKAPNTYTREDIVEINCHGGPAPLRRVLELVLKYGARLAEPGEFTQRAFLSGRMDLAQAEAVLDVINALTEQSRRAAVEQLRGGLSRKLGAIREKLIELTALVEAHIDFPEEDIEPLSLKEMKRRAVQVQQSLRKLIESSRYGMILREGLKTAIIGRPNVGKSSLLNALLEHDRAIVTEMPGTTRDVIEEHLNINGIPVRIMDTAGIREGKDVAEKEGVKRSLRAMEDADLVLLVLDGSEAMHETDMELIEKSQTKNRIIVINKTDLPGKLNLKKMEQSITGQRITDENKNVIPLKVRIVTISAKKATGLDELRNKIAESILTSHAGGNVQMVTNVRHVRALEKALSSIDSFLPELAKKTSPEFLAVELRDALDAIGEIIGITTPDDILNRIFSNFCIGK
jgi:tRNA modification GTPase